MGLPLYDAHSDPGPSFFQYAQSAGLNTAPNALNEFSPHATTVIAVRFDQGVVMVGDRQATGNYIASRDVRKIEPADRFTALAISGTAARGIEFIRMAQLSFEHYEKMTDSALSLEGKANYLSPIIQRNNLGSPLIVLPLLAGWDPDGSSSTTGRAGATSVSISRPLVRARRSPKARFAWAFARTSTARPRSNSVPWRSTRRATTTRRPGDLTSCATSIQ